MYQGSFSNDIVLFFFEISGPNHVNTFIRPKKDVYLARWSMGDHKPVPTLTPKDMLPTFYIYYSYGLKPDHPFQFWIELIVSLV